MSCKSCLLKSLTLMLVSLSVWVSSDEPMRAQEEPSEAPIVVPRLQPVIAQSARDGLLLGGDFRLTIGAWEVGLGGAYGFESRRARYRTSFGYQQAVELSYGDWPKSFVLGRQGEQGVHVAVDLIALYRLLQGERLTGGWEFLAEALARSQLRGTGFLGRLWPGEGEEEGPEVRYLHLRGFIHWPLPRGGAFETRGELLFGQSTQTMGLFQTFFSASRLQVAQTTLEWQLGELDNPAGLPGFQFDLGLRSYPQSLVGDRFLLVLLERRFEVVSGFLQPIDLTALLGPELGWIPVHASLQVSIFFEGGAVFQGGESAMNVLFGWGASLLVPEIDLQITWAINRQGEPSLTIRTSVLP